MSPGIHFYCFAGLPRCQYCHIGHYGEVGRPTNLSCGRWTMSCKKLSVIRVSGVTRQYHRQWWRSLTADWFLILFFFTKAGTGIHCTLDTCAHTFRNTPRYLKEFDKLMAVTIVLLDIKEINEEQLIVTSQITKIFWLVPKNTIWHWKACLDTYVLVPGLMTVMMAWIELLGKFVRRWRMLISLKFYLTRHHGRVKWQGDYPLQAGRC